MEILFLGSGAFGLPTLRALSAPGSGHEVIGVVTQPDRPAGRDRRLTPTPVGAYAAEHLPGVPILKPENINSPADLKQVRALGASPSTAWVVIAYGQKLSRDLIEGVFAINLHGSLLPRWRGAAPINHAILAGDAVSGNSVITIADRMDAGLILAQSEPPIRIDPGMTAGELHDALADDGPACVLRVLAAHQAGSLRGREQDEALVTRATKLSRADAWLDFAAGAEACRRRIHGLTPWPGVTVHIHHPSEPDAQARGASRTLATLKLLRVEALPGETQQLPVPPGVSPGALIDAAAGLVKCGGTGILATNRTPAAPTILRLLEVQPAGKRPMSWSDFIRGHPIQNGAMLQSDVAWNAGFQPARSSATPHRPSSPGADR